VIFSRVCFSAVGDSAVIVVMEETETGFIAKLMIRFDGLIQNPWACL
jgi:hypothetical protein